MLPGTLTRYPDDWTHYQTGEVTKGGENPVPGISWFYPAAGAAIDGATFSVNWAPVEKATGYRFQMSKNSGFSPLLVDKVLVDAAYRPSKEIPPKTVAAGTYYWRVKVLLPGGESPWSDGVQIISESLTLMTGSGGPLGYADKTLGIAWKLQHKDTKMLCLDDCPFAVTGDDGAWDQPHDKIGIHGRMYCVRASIAMAASYYGGKLSQDRITYEIFRGKGPEGSGPPEGDLGHNVGVDGPPDPTATNTFAWALGIAPADILEQAGKPTFNQIKAWIDANRPILAAIPGHMRVIDGYRELSATRQYIHLLDPAVDANLVSYATDNIFYVWVGPAGPGGAPNVRSDEDTLKSDLDLDNILDFDEINRFKTDPMGDDSDLDWVKDKQEIQDYIFEWGSGPYMRQDPDTNKRDGRKELDPDNDGGGLIDGCEEDIGTDSFDASDDTISSSALIYPSGTINSSHPTYKWNAVCGAKSYWLQVDDSTGRRKIYQGFSARDTGCASGTGTCSVTPSISIAEGNATWWIAACHSIACGDWSNALGFIVNTTPQDPIVGLWNTPDGGQALMAKSTTGGYEFVAKVTQQGTWWTQRSIMVGDVVWRLDKQPDGHYKGEAAVNGNTWYWWPMEVWVDGNVMKDSTGATVATRAQ